MASSRAGTRSFGPFNVLRFRKLPRILRAGEGNNRCENKRHLPLFCSSPPLFFPVVISNRPWSLCSSFSCRIQDSSLSSSWNLRCKISYEWIKDRNNCKRNQNSFLECWNFEFKNLDDSERKLSLRELRYVENNGEQSSNLDSVFEEGDKFDAGCSRVKMEIHSPTR